MDDSKVEISKSKVIQLKNLIKANCCSHYDNTLLPENPWFIHNENESTSILKSLLKASQNEISKFSQKLAETILYYNQLDIAYTLNFLNFQQEQKEISDLLNLKTRQLIETSKADFTVVKTRSNLGPIQVDLKISHKSLKLDPNSRCSFLISLEDSVKITISVNSGSSFCILDNFQVYFRDLYKEEILGTKEGDIQKVFNRKGGDFEAKILLSVVLSDKDRRSVYERRLNALEESMKEENKSGIIYLKLIDSLDIYHDLDSGQFKSRVKALRQNRESCCGRCGIF